MPGQESDTLITRDGQIQWGGLLLGPGTPYGIAAEGLAGWGDLPALDTADVLHPAAHGAWPGAQWAQPRTVTGTIWLLPADRDRTIDVMREFRAATGLVDEERWLAVRLHGETLLARARVSQRVVPTDRTYATQGVAKATVQWICTDPRRYGALQESAQAGLPTEEEGLLWTDPAAPAAPEGLDWAPGLDWGAAGSTGDLTAYNDGDAPTGLVVEFRGPVRNPSLTRLSDGIRIEYGITLAESDVLTVDTEAGTVLLNGASSRLHTATPGSVPEQLFHLPPGSTSLAFRAAPGSSDPLASATVMWRSAHW